jgi:signal transduction histidine kinase
MTPTIGGYLYLLLLGFGLALANWLLWPYTKSHQDPVGLLAFLIPLGALMNLAEVRLDRGRLSLRAVVISAAAILTNPLSTTVVAIASSIVGPKRGRWSILVNVLTGAAWGCASAIVAAFLRPDSSLSLGSRLVVVIALSLANWIFVGLVFVVRHGESPGSIVRRNFTPSFYAAFAYFGLAGLLLSYVLDGTPLGYVLGTIVCVLALALTDTIAGRRVRTVLESELSDADRHLFHSRAVEGVVHNLRNHMANVVGYLREIDPRRLDPIDRENIQTATGAATDAVSVLRTLSQGATPRVSFSPDPVELNELVARAIGMARPRARVKRIELTVRESPDALKVHVDPLLMREVLTNLINNAIDAAPDGGRVEAVTGRGSNGAPYFTIRDNGPGVADENRRRLFEPHFTTKEGGTGLGLFMSYGVVREHQGDLVYSGDRKGAAFTVVLPPFGG